MPIQYQSWHQKHPPDGEVANAKIESLLHGSWIAHLDSGEKQVSTERGKDVQERDFLSSHPSDTRPCPMAKEGAPTGPLCSLCFIDIPGRAVTLAAEKARAGNTQEGWERREGDLSSSLAL